MYAKSKIRDLFPLGSISLLSYEANLIRALQIFNPGTGAAIGGPTGALPVLYVGQQQMANLGLINNNLQGALYALPGRDVRYRRNSITPQQIQSRRPSYINAILIQRAGVVQTPPCLQCQRRGMRPFPECRRAPGHFGGCCGNCKWRDHAAGCTVRDGQDLEEESSSESDGDNPPQGGPPQDDQQDGPPSDVRVEVQIPPYDPNAPGPASVPAN